MKNINCDVLIVGASSAGLGAALSLADSGIKVICVDKKNKIGVPVKCAEGIGKFFVDILPVKIPKKFLKWKIKGIAFFKDDFKIKKKGPFWEGYSVNRDEIEDFFYKKAKSKGVRFILKHSLISFKKNKDKTINSVLLASNKSFIRVFPKHIIAADGVDSKVLKLLKIPKKEKITGEIVNYEVRSNNLELIDYEQIYLGDFAPNGYGFIFPKSKTIANVGVGCINYKGNIQKCFKEFMSLSIVKSQLKGMSILKDKSKTAIFGDQLYKSVHENVIFCGDVANHNFKPFIEGFLPSFISGFTAGKLVLSGDISALKYDALIEESLPGFKDTKVLQKAMLQVFKEKSNLRNNHLFLLSSGLISPEQIKSVNFKKSESIIKKNCSILKEF
ncbi:MAG: Digeranylgeranylglycerophospholipid reductase [archaeon ADurb.Bin336]|nr:MAG: Digeranylgeranylglycerophospholipid reductase [archaeon ADurb.Bin336]